MVLTNFNGSGVGFGTFNCKLPGSLFSALCFHEGLFFYLMCKSDRLYEVGLFGMSFVLLRRMNFFVGFFPSQGSESGAGSVSDGVLEVCF